MKGLNASALSVTIAVLIVVLIIALSGFGAYVAFNIQRTASNSTISCSTGQWFGGLGGACIAYWNASYPLTINYSGSWSASYFGYDTNIKNVSGSFNGTGFYYRTMNLNVYGLAMPTLCVNVTKLDSSNATLTLSLGANNSTSLAHGSVSSCVAEGL